MSVQDTVSEAEWLVRQDLAAFYRLVAEYGWDDLLLAHLSCRVPGEDAYLINPFGLLFEEITASSLLKVDYTGQKLHESEYEISPEANVIHGALLVARQDVNSVAHVHTMAGTAIASRVEGLRNITQVFRQPRRFRRIQHHAFVVVISERTGNDHRLLGDVP